MSEFEDAKKLVTKEYKVKFLVLIDLIIMSMGLGAGLTMASSTLGIVVLIAAGLLVVLQVYDRIVHG